VEAGEEEGGAGVVDEGADLPVVARLEAADRAGQVVIERRETGTATDVEVTAADADAAAGIDADVEAGPVEHGAWRHRGRRQVWSRHVGRERASADDGRKQRGKADTEHGNPLPISRMPYGSLTNRKGGPSGPDHQLSSAHR